MGIMPSIFTSNSQASQLPLTQHPKHHLILFSIMFCQIQSILFPSSYNMAFYPNKHNYRHTNSPLPNHNLLNSSSEQPSPRPLIRSPSHHHKERFKNNNSEIILLQMIEEPGLLKMINKGGQNMYLARKQAMMEMTKYRYKKMIELQNKRLMERQQFENELQKSKNEMMSKISVQANRIKAETRDSGRSVRNWMKRNCKEGELIRQNKQLNQAIKFERDMSQLQKKKEDVHNPRPKKIISEFNRTSYNQYPQPSKLLSIRKLSRTQYKPHHDNSNTSDFPLNYRRIQQPTNQKQSYGLFNIWVMPSHNKLLHQAQ